MLRHAMIPLDRAWNTWSARPAEMTFLPLGVQLTPLLYSTRLRKASLIAPGGGGVRLGAHAIDGSRVRMEVDHGGSTIELSYWKDDPFIVSGAWRTLANGEWGLRFWVTICLSADGGEVVRYRPEAAAAVVKVGRRYVALVSAAMPIQVTGHENVAALAADFEANGYFHLASRANEAPVIALRFNLEMMAGNRFCAAVADDADIAIERARAALNRPPFEPEVLHQGAGALDAVRDIVAWNTIFDPVNRRPYTTVSRIWPLGDFAVWFNDQTYAALMAGNFDALLAFENISVAVNGATPEGNVACIVTSKDAWVDRSQPPLTAFISWLLHLQIGDRASLVSTYFALARNQRWWRTHRDPDGSGLVSCGSSSIGEALYVGTHFGARNESGMDNSATHDEAVWDPATRTLSTSDLGLNCALALDAEILSLIAAEVGRPEEAAEFAVLAEASRRLIRERLWDPERRIFANRQRTGGFVRSLSPTSFYPLLCGAASAEQAEALLAHLADPATFAGPFGLPNATRDDPAFQDNVYWRGRIWPNVNYLVWHGLNRYGYHRQARDLAAMSLRLFINPWHESRIAAENYNATTGEPMDQPDTDPFYIWAGLLPLMAVGEICRFDPWHGWTLVNDGRDVTLGPMLTPIGPATVRVSEGVLALERAGAVVLQSGARGRFRDLWIEPARFAVTLDLEAPAGTLRLPAIKPSSVVAVRLDGGNLGWKAVGEGIEIDLVRVGQGSRITVHIDP